MKQNEQRIIFKIESNELKKSKWNLNITLESALQDTPDMVVSIGESQLIRWIDELRGVANANAEIKAIKKKISRIRNSAENSKSKVKLKKLYTNLNQLKYLPDLVAVVMRNNSDYDRANKGFNINGVKYRRLLGTSGGIKKNTIFYIAEDLHADIMRKIENNRNPNKELVAAKLEAYRALTCSESVPIPKPQGIIVVKDCITHFKENVIVIDDSAEGEPKLNAVDNYEIEHNNSDGFGLMLPSYAAKVNKFLTGDFNPLSGMVIRYAFTKGMLATFDFIEFAEKIAGTYEITDVWGNPRDIRNAEVILTESQLKLWDSYFSFEDYEKNCIANHYEFAVSKTCPMNLESVHTTNYQFLQPYDLTNKEIIEMCSPSVHQIKQIMNLDYRKSLIYLGGKILNVDNWVKAENYVKALMINPLMINDPYIKARISSNIEKQIERAKRGKIAISANYAMIVGDPFALCQSIFGMNITGLLNAGEVYHKFWIDKGADEIVCFRAPMSVKNNIVKQKLTESETAKYWFRYINTVCVLNAWDSTAEAENGADFDGDTFYCTDNGVITRNTEKLPTIICLQRKASKSVPTEDDIIATNKISFSDEIGKITNVVTAMYDVRAGFDQESKEYKELTYRIMCGQHFQQGQIDKAKGAVIKPMPEYWKKAKSVDELTDFQRAIIADKKPYFFRYVYPSLNSEYQNHVKKYHLAALKKTGLELKDLTSRNDEQAQRILADYKTKAPLTDNGCTVNKIAHYIESQMQDFKEFLDTQDFDFNILKSDTCDYSKCKFNLIKKVYQDYQSAVAEYKRRVKCEKIDNEKIKEHNSILIESFKQQCAMICPDDGILANILIDMVYSKKGKSKAFAWLICGDTIIKNLLAKANYKITIPIQTMNNGEFEYMGMYFSMNENKVNNYDEKDFNN